MKIRYTNYKGVTSDRNIIPLLPYFGSSEYHPEKQWLLKVWDIDKRAMRSFAIKDIKRPMFTKYNQKEFRGWDIAFVDWSIGWEVDISEKYEKEWKFEIQKFNHTYNDSRLPDTIFYICSCDVFTWFPDRVRFGTRFKEFDIFGMSIGIWV